MVFSLAGCIVCSQAALSVEYDVGDWFVEPPQGSMAFARSLPGWDDDNLDGFRFVMTGYPQPSSVYF